MKAKLLITSLSLIATSVYAQPSVPAVGIPPPTVRAEMPGQGVPSMPQPAMQRPVPQPAVGATGGTGGAGGNGGLLVGNGGAGGSGATPKPPSTMYNGVGPLPANNAKAPTSVGSTQSEAQAFSEARAEARAEAQAKGQSQGQSQGQAARAEVQVKVQGVVETTNQTK